MADNNILDKLVKKYKTIEERRDKFIKKLFPDVSLRHFVDRRARLYDGDIADENNCKIYIRYLRHHWFLLKESTTFRESYYQQQLKIEQIEDMGHYGARELTKWLSDDAYRKLTAFIERYTEHCKSIKTKVIETCDQPEPEIDEETIVKPKASLKKESTKRKQLIRKKRAEEEAFLTEAIQDNEKILSKSHIYYKDDQDIPDKMYPIILCILTEYLSPDFLGSMGFINPLFALIVEYNIALHLKRINICKNTITGDVYKKMAVYTMVAKKMCDTMKNDLFYSMVSASNFEDWSDNMYTFGYSINNRVIKSYVTYYYEIFAKNPRLREEFHICDVNCLVCVIKYHYYITKKEKLSILPCKEICRRSLYKIAMEPMINIVNKMYIDYRSLFNKGIYINNTDLVINDTDLFIYIPYNICTNTKIQEWLYFISWCKNCQLEHLTEKPGLYPKTTSILYKWTPTL